MRLAKYMVQRALLALVFLPPFLHAQTPPAYQQWPDCAVAFTIATAGVSSARIDNTQVGCTAWAVQYSTTALGAGPSQSLRFESAVDGSGSPGAWGAYNGTILQGINPMTVVGSEQSLFYGYVPWVRVTLTAANNVSVRGNLYGWKARPSTTPGTAADVNVLNWPPTQNINGNVGVNNFPAIQPVSGNVVVTGAVDVNNFPATQPVSGTVGVNNFPATQPVSGNVAVTNLPVTQPVSGTVNVGNFPATQPVSGNVVVTGTVGVNNFPATQPVSGTVAVNNFPSSQAIKVADSPSIDAFSRLRVSNPDTLFDSQQEYILSTYDWNTVTATGGTTSYQSARSSTYLTTNSTNGSRALIQTRAYFRYQPGKSQLLVFTGVYGNTSTNNAHRVGQFDDNNGLYLEVSGSPSAASFTRRTDTSGVVANNSVAQASWSLDPMDGTGPSGITLDFTKTQILIIDYQWLGVGRVRLGFDVGGLVYYAHEFRNANNLTVVYMRTPNLPVRFENLNTGAAGAGTTMEAICSSIMSEGGFETNNGYTRGASTAITSYTVNATYQPVLCIRPSLTFQGKQNRSTIVVESLEILSSGLTYYALDYYGTPTGGTFVTIPGTSPVQTDGASVAGTTRSTAITSGIRTYKGFIGTSGGGNRTLASSHVITHMPITISFDGTVPDYVCVCAQSFSGNVTVSASINWREMW